MVYQQPFLVFLPGYGALTGVADALIIASDSSSKMFVVTGNSGYSTQNVYKIYWITSSGASATPFSVPAGQGAPNGVAHAQINEITLLK